MSEVTAPVLRAANDAELKTLVKGIADVMTLLSSVSSGFSFAEVAQLIHVGEDIPAIVKDVNVLIPEYKALDDAARADLVAYVNANVVFPVSKNVEQLVQKSLDVAIALSALFKTA